MNGGMQKTEQQEYDDGLSLLILDTAAARLRRYYGFEDVNAKIRALCQSGKRKWSMTRHSILQKKARGWEWEVTPEVIIKWGRIWGKRNLPATYRHRTGKNGSGTHMYITYSASYSDTPDLSLFRKYLKPRMTLQPEKGGWTEGNEIISVRKSRLQAKDIARIWSALISGRIIFRKWRSGRAWARGHLLEQAEPEVYGAQFAALAAECLTRYSWTVENGG